MDIRILLLITFCSIQAISTAQITEGKVINREKNPIAYVNIGIPGKQIGTVSDEKGHFRIDLSSLSGKDTLKFSCIGYESKSILIGDLGRFPKGVVALTKATFDIPEVTVHSKKLTRKTLGIESTSQVLVGGFKEVLLGQEYGILIKNRGTAILETLNINVARCSYDSIFFRVNICTPTGKRDFTTVLREPIYLQYAKNEVGNKLTIDLIKHNLTIKGDFLVTLENVKDLGEGSLFFCGSILHKTYYRNTSQASWIKVPLGASFNVDALVEK